MLNISNMNFHSFEQQKYASIFMESENIFFLVIWANWTLTICISTNVISKKLKLFNVFLIQVKFYQLMSIPLTQHNILNKMSSYYIYTNGDSDNSANYDRGWNEHEKIGWMTFEICTEVGIWEIEFTQTIWNVSCALDLIKRAQGVSKG